MKFLLLVLFFFTLLACRPEQEATEFNVLVKVPQGQNVTVSTDEDIPLDWTYAVEKNAESVALKLKMVKEPSFGKLENCNHSSDIQMGCRYIPNENFSGTDTIEFQTVDGELQGEERSVITIIVNEIPDAPRALDDSHNAKSGQTVNFQLPEGLDGDSLKNELNYEIISGPENINLNCSGRNCTFSSDDLFAGNESLIYKIVDESQLESNVATVDIIITPEVKALTETFTQDVDNLNGVDIVWVIDNSGSMQDNQETLKANFTNFIDNFLVDGKARFPFNMAIITSDAYRLADGSQPYAADEVGNRYDLSSTRAENDFAGFKSDFEAAVLVGTNGNGSERSFQSMDRAYQLGPAFYGGNDKILSYIIVSDEREQSTSRSIAEWMAQFQALKDSANKLLIYPIINVNADNENRYAEAAQLSGTQVYNINDPFADILNNISLNVANRVSSYNLNQQVNILPDTLVVTINDTPTTEYEFSPQTNSIRLTNAPAGQLATIKVMYSFYGAKGYAGQP